MLRFPGSSATFREGEWKTSLRGKPCGRMLKFGDGFGDKGNVSSGMYTAGPGVRAHPALAGGQVGCWQRAVPVASHAFLSIQLPSALTGPFFSGDGLRGLRGGGHRVTSVQPRRWEAVESRVVTCGLFREMRRDGAGRGLRGSGGRGRSGAEPQSFGSKWRWSEGGETTWTTRQLCLLGSREAGREVSCRVGFYKASAETVPWVPAAWGIPSMPECT